MTAGTPVVLWDLDGTLLRSERLARRSWHVAFERVTGHETPVLAERPGATARDLIDQCLRLAGLPEDPIMRSEFFSEMGRLYVDLQRSEPEDCVALPGAALALKKLASRHLLQSVVTGNVQVVAAAKLRGARLAGWIRPDAGAYGDESRSRARLVEMAISRVARLTSQDRSASCFVVVGDSAQDMMAARAAGATGIGIASTAAHEGTLRRTGASVVAGSADDLPSILSCWDAERGRVQ